MDLRQHAEVCPLLEMSAQGRTADLAGGRRQAAPRRPLPEKLAQGGHHPNRRRSGMATTPLLRWRAEIDDRRDEVQKSEIQLPSPMSDTSDMVINDQRCSAFR